MTHLGVLDQLLSNAIKTMNKERMVNIPYPNAYADKLDEDGYFKKTEHGAGDDHTFQVTLNGIIFNELGGYSEKNRRETIQISLQSKQKWAILAGTVLGGLVGIDLLYKWIRSFLVFCGC